jgi:hypothetical protein
MSDQSEHRQRASHVIVWMIGVLLFVVGYVASFGPVNWFVSRNYISSQTYDRLCDTVYAPFVWVDMNTEFFTGNPVGVIYADYVEWFTY